MGNALLLALSFAVILAGALLFTTAVEWAGHRLDLAEGATGSLLAAVGTAMPETLIPIVAIVGGSAGADDVAIGAIIGAPFLLATIAMAVVGISALIYRGRRPEGTRLRADTRVLDRDLVFFGIFFAAGLGLGLGVPDAVQIPCAVGFVLAYGVYVRRTLRGGGEVQDRRHIAAAAARLRPPATSPATERSRSSSWSGSGRWSAARTCSSRSSLPFPSSSAPSRWCSP